MTNKSREQDRIYHALGPRPGELSWTHDGIIYEADPKHAQLVPKESAMECARPVGMPMSNQELKELATVLDENGKISENDFMIEKFAQE